MKYLEPFGIPAALQADESPVCRRVICSTSYVPIPGAGIASARIRPIGIAWRIPSSLQEAPHAFSDGVQRALITAGRSLSHPAFCRGPVLDTNMRICCPPWQDRHKYPGLQQKQSCWEVLTEDGIPLQVTSLCLICEMGLRSLWAGLV